jgi:hypothetical protein
MPFESLTDKVERAKWLMSQSKSSNVLDVLTGPEAGKAAEALSDEKTVNQALVSLLNEEGPEDWFNSGGSIGGKKTLDDAAEWISTKASTISEAAFMKQGFAKPPASMTEQVNYRGQMPMQLPGIALIGTEDDFRKFVGERDNAGVYSMARVMAKNGDETRTLPQIAQVASEQLDAIKAIGEAKESMLKQVRANPKAPVPSPDKFVTSAEWKAATGESSVPSDPTVLSNYDVQAKSMLVQQAWSLAVTARVLDAVNGGDAWDPKVPSRLLEPIGKAARKRRKTLVNVLGDPIRV